MKNKCENENLITKFRIWILYYFPVRILPWLLLLVILTQAAVSCVESALNDSSTFSFVYWMVSSIVLVRIMHARLNARCPECYKPVHKVMKSEQSSTLKNMEWSEMMRRTECIHCGYHYDKKKPSRSPGSGVGPE